MKEAIEIIEMYYVGSNGDTPNIIFFNAESAFESRYEYIDSFNSKGEKIQGYKRDDDGYTTDF